MASDRHSGTVNVKSKQVFFAWGILSSLAIAFTCLPQGYRMLAHSRLVCCQANLPNLEVQKVAQLTTVRILTQRASGSGVIVQRQEQIYTVLTSWHVVRFSDKQTIMTPDGQQYSPLGKPRQVGDTDLAIIQFSSAELYEVTNISTEPDVKGESVFAAGFPMYHRGTLNTTFNLGIQTFRFTQGKVLLLLPKPLEQGYRLGYTNDIEAGMSGGPIFQAQGRLIGINGRLKERDPDFGVYAFEDGTQPPPEMIEQMVRSSWGIPISTYLEFVSLNF